MEILQAIWTYAIPIGAGSLTVGAIIAAIVAIIFKGYANKAISKINVEAVEKKAVEKGIEKVKVVSFQHSIQPVVESGLEKVNEKSIAFIKPKLEELDNKYDKIITCFEKFYLYFDNAIGVSDEKKADLAKAISDAKRGQETVESVISTVYIEEEEKAEKTPVVAAKKEIGVER